MEKLYVPDVAHLRVAHFSLSVLNQYLIQGFLDGLCDAPSYHIHDLALNKRLEVLKHDLNGFGEIAGAIKLHVVILDRELNIRDLNLKGTVL